MEELIKTKKEGKTPRDLRYLGKILDTKLISWVSLALFLQRTNNKNPTNIRKLSLTSNSKHNLLTESLKSFPKVN